jgi:hypothetical protein
MVRRCISWHRTTPRASNNAFHLPLSFCHSTAKLLSLGQFLELPENFKVPKLITANGKPRPHWKRPGLSWENNYGTTLPPLGASRRQLGRGCDGGAPLWQNTIEYKWLGLGKFLTAAWCLRSCQSTDGFGRGAWASDDLQKEDTVASRGGVLPKGDPAALP